MVVFGVFMICVYLGMAWLIGINHFGWSDTPVMKVMRLLTAVVLGAYGVYRCYRLVKGIDYYHHDRDYYNDYIDNDDY